MKLQIDTTNKTIKVEGDVVISELIATLSKMFPKDEWKEFLLKTETQIVNWGYPIYVKELTTWPNYPWYVNYGAATMDSNHMTISDASANVSYALTGGVFNVEC